MHRRVLCYIRHAEPKATTKVGNTNAYGNPIRLSKIP